MKLILAGTVETLQQNPKLYISWNNFFLKIFYITVNFMKMELLGPGLSTFCGSNMELPGFILRGYWSTPLK
jgi:hypothetical protein